MANKKISELPYINVTKISGNTLVPLVTYFSAATGDTVHTYANDLKSFITSGISVSGNFLPLSGGTVSGGTRFLSGLTANTISATTYFNLPSSTFSGGTVTGPTIFTNGLTANTISATTYQNLPTDVRVTGGTYSAGNILFTNNTGGTFNVTGLTTGSTSTVSGDFLPLSGGTVTGGTIFTSGVTANTISNTDYIDFNTGTTNPSTIAGRTFFDNGEKALSYYGIGSNIVPIAMGQQLYVRGNNATGSQINKGSVVMVTGTTNTLPSIALATNNHAQGSPRPIGLAAENIPSGNDGLVIVNGILSGITLNTFANGDTLYLSDTIPGGYVSSTSSLPFSARTNEIGYVLQTGTTTGKIYVNINSEDSNLTLTDIERNILEGNVISTGAYEYTGMTQGTGSTINISPMRGWIVQNTYSYSTLPDVNNLYYPGGTNIPITNLTTADATYILVNSGSTLVQQTTFPTPQERRENIYLGRIGHADRLTITNLQNATDFDVSPMAAIRDLWTPLKLINQGIIVSPNGVNMNINTSAGSLWGNGIGWYLNQLNPDSVSISGTSPTTFQYRTQFGSITGGTIPSGNTTTIQPGYYDLNGVVTAVGGGSNSSTNQRVYLFPTGLVRIQLGQTVYSTIAAAVAASQNEAFVEFGNNRDNGILIGIISLDKNASVGNGGLVNTTYAKFNYVSKFGELLGGTGGLSTTTLQQAYDNSVTPEITTNSSLGPLSVKNGTGNDDNVTNVFEGVNSGGTTTSIIRADGFISGNSLNATNIIISGGTQSIFSGNSSSDLVRITQTGVGNAFVVDDSTNPDTTPFVINSGGSVSIGTTSVFSVGAGAETKLNVSTGSSGVATTGLSVSTPVIIESTVGTSIGLFNPDVANSQLYFGTPSDAFGAFLRWDYTNRNLILSTANSTGKLIFQTANSVESARIDQSGNMGIGLTGATQKLEVSGNTRIYGGISAQTATISGSGQSILTVIGSGNSTTSPLFTVQGSSGELFSVNDSLVGSLFSVNDISGLPILEVFSDNTTLMGSYQAPSLNTTTRVTLTAGTNTVYSIPTSAYTGAFIDYTLVSTGTTGARAGNIMTIWSGSTAQYTETSTNDIGNTAGVTFSVAVSGNNAVLSSSATTTGWTLKTIVRSI
jgi:hypothetical protein